jgi:hypothetical protein
MKEMVGQFVMPDAIRHPGNPGAWIADQVRNDNLGSAMTTLGAQ